MDRPADTVVERRAEERLGLDGHNGAVCRVARHAVVAGVESGSGNKSAVLSNQSDAWPDDRRARHDIELGRAEYGKCV